MAERLFDPDSELGRDLAAVDWSATPLGPVERWPTSLRNVVQLQLGSRFAMWMAWGPELTFLCNDAYRRGTLGAKYPWALGKPAREVWSEIWPDIGPRIQSVIDTGVATWDESLLLFLERSGYQEETYHTFSYSPITDDDGTIAGMLCVVSEETGRIVSERRMTTVRQLGTALAAASTVDEVCAAAGRQLALDSRNVPFAVGYLFDNGRTRAELAWTAGVRDRHPLAPWTIRVGQDGVWPAAEVLRHGVRLVENLPERVPDVPTGAWQEPVQHALVLPLTQPGQRAPFGFLVAGLNRYRPLDSDARSFLELIAGQIAAAVTRARAFEEERQRAEDLAALDRAKTTFFTNVSHELRTPLTLLLGPASDALADEVAPLPDRQRQRMEVVQRNGERLLKLVNTLLDFSRLESGRVQGRFESLDLARYTSELAGMFESALHRAGLALTVECRPLSRRAHVDREMWAKIVLNLLSNALKATFDGGVTVRLVERDGAAELSVADTGVGIPPAEQHRLFERFHRVTGAQLRSHEGSGIGLALVAELAALHGGTVSVASTPGAGSTFTVRIPIGTDHLPAEQVLADPLDEPLEAAQYGAGYLAEVDRWLAAEPDEPPPALGERPRVLVVDDNADMRDYVSGLLRDDYWVRTARDGQEALDTARADPPDLVLTDVMMPRLDGFGLLAALRTDPATMHVPVVMISARSGDEAAVVGLEAGADDYLVKPFSARELQARVRANLELDRVRRVAGELVRSRELLDQAEELAHVGSWELDLATGEIAASAEYLRIVGLTAQEIAEGGLPMLLPRVPESHRGPAVTKLQTSLDDGRPFELEFPFRTPERGVRILHARGLPHESDDGRRLLRGSVQDVTDQRAAERAVAATAAAREAAAREHAIADELQRSLLPANPPRCTALDVAAYYVAGVRGTQAGGDWYDVVELSDGRTALVIGDVMGRGVHAAAVMGQLRATVRAYARLDLPPAVLLGLLDAAVCEMGEATIVTCIYAVHDPEAGTLTYANAGHLPPLLSVPGGPARRLTAGDPPLGTDRYRGDVETVAWPAGARLTLYTDGLVEHRGSDIDAGIDRLAAALHETTGPIESVPGAVVAAVLPQEPDDDVAVLVAEVVRPDRRCITLTVPTLDTGVTPVRHAARDALAEWGVDADLADDVLLLVSELVTNAVQHGRAPIAFQLRSADGALVLEVADGSPVRPQVRELDPAAAGGRGLRLVESLSGTWGIRPTGLGKAVWCVLPLSQSVRR